MSFRSILNWQTVAIFWHTFYTLMLLEGFITDMRCIMCPITVKQSQLFGTRAEGEFSVVSLKVGWHRVRAQQRGVREPWLERVAWYTHITVFALDSGFVSNPFFILGIFRCGRQRKPVEMSTVAVVCSVDDREEIGCSTKLKQGF